MVKMVNFMLHIFYHNYKLKRKKEKEIKGGPMVRSRASFHTLFLIPGEC